MENPSVSVLIPVYNGEAYLAESLQSIADQSLRSIEVIIIDDHSTDRSREICETFCANDDRFKYFLNLKGKGLVSALNYGLELCNAELVARMDADDISLPTRLETQLEHFCAHPNTALVGTGFEVFDSIKKLFVIKHPSNPIICSWGFTWNSKVGHPTVMFRKTLIKQLGNYPDFRAEDLALFSELSRNHIVTNIPKVLLRYRVHNANKSIQESRAVTEEVYALSKKSLATITQKQVDHRLYVDFHTGKKIPLRKLPAVTLLSATTFFKTLQHFASATTGKERFDSVAIFLRSMLHKLAIQLGLWRRPGKPIW